MKSSIIIFTDLDGTLLDHNNYSYTAAEPCLSFLRKHEIPLIFTSSKTAVEIEALCVESNFYHPFIAENGGLLSIPKNYFSANSITTKKYTKTILGVARNEITKILSPLKTSYKFTSFNDMSIDELVEHTGLTKQQAIFANQRDATEPLIWRDEESKLKVFKKELAQHNLSLISGGRFHHVMANHDKSTTMLMVIEKYRKYDAKETISIALGDSPNDMKMLKTADHAILIPNSNAPKLCDTNHVNLIHAQHAGPQGWNESLLALLKELTK